MNPWLYSLQALGPMLETYLPPGGENPNQPSGQTVECSMAFLSLTIRPRVVGAIDWKSRGDEIEFAISRPAEDGYLAYTELRYRLNPDGWRIEEWSGRDWLAPADDPGAVFRMTEHQCRGEVVGRDARLERDGVKRTQRLTQPLAGKWPLLETIRRHGLEAGKTLSFDCLDEAEVIHPGHTLEPGEWAETPAGFPMRPFLHTGTGQIPRILWIDEFQRPIVWQAGTEAAILVALNGQEGEVRTERYDQREIRLPQELAR